MLAPTEVNQVIEPEKSETSRRQMSENIESNLGWNGAAVVPTRQYDWFDEMFGLISQSEILKSFRMVLNKLNRGYGGKPRRKPVRLLRIIEAFKRGELDSVTLDGLAEEFAGTKDPRVHASNAIGWLNGQLEEVGSPLEIERVTIYRFKYRS